MDTRTQAPSGAGYALENRITVSRVFPDAFRELHVPRLAPFFRTLQETLLKTSPFSRGSDGGSAIGGDGAPHVVLLTPGRTTRPTSNTPISRAISGSRWRKAAT